MSDMQSQVTKNTEYIVITQIWIWFTSGKKKFHFSSSKFATKLDLKFIIITNKNVQTQVGMIIV